jgi:hypothetical protein
LTLGWLEHNLHTLAQDIVFADKRAIGVSLEEKEPWVVHPRQALFSQKN